METGPTKSYMVRRWHERHTSSKKEENLLQQGICPKCQSHCLIIYRAHGFCNCFNCGHYAEIKESGK